MKRFNIRVYGICINERSEVLLSDESHAGRSFTKFPGGGLEFGEGTLECLKREFREEFALEIEVGELYYLTDFFQISAFSENDQVISAYYLIHADTIRLDQLVSTPIGSEKLHWKKISELHVSQLTFPIDQFVVSKLINNLR